MYLMIFDDSKIYTAKQIAEGIMATEDFIWREIREGRLRGIKLAHRVVRLRGSDVNAWLERGLTTLLTTEPSQQEAARG